MKNFMRRLRGDQRGVVAVIAGFGIVGFVGFAAIVVDVGYLIYTKRALQASTDAAAMAGAQEIFRGNPTGATTVATNYSSVSGAQNVKPNFTATMVTGYPQLKCYTSVGSCSLPNNPNGIAVRQTADVPLFFGRVLGLNTATVTVSAAAASTGGAATIPVDVMIVLDTTASMNESHNSTLCSAAGVGSSKLDCAFYGFRTLLSGFKPSLDYAGLMIFPGLKPSTSPTKTAAQNAALEYDCSSSTPADNNTYSRSSISKYDEPDAGGESLPRYRIVDLTNDYKTSDSATTLNTASNLVKAARGGAAGCKQGVTAYGGVKTYYAEAIAEAKAYLAANARAGTQRVIIVLSDGDANVDYGIYTSQKQCRKAMEKAQEAKDADMIVITVAYNASTSSSASCPYDRSNGQSISACEAMRQMASNNSRFYATNTSGSTSCTSVANPITELNAIFQHIGTTIGTGARLLPDSTS